MLRSLKRLIKMRKGNNKHTSLAPYTVPMCRMAEVKFDQNFLASETSGGTPGLPIEPGDEFEF